MPIQRSNLPETFDMSRHIRQSNLIEGVDDPFEDRLSFAAWQWLVKQPRLSRERVLTLHRMIMLGKLGAEHLGQTRRVNVWIGGRKAPEPYAAVHMLAEWMLSMKSWRDHDTKKMHIWFEYIHPFVDGNGRTGRMLMWWHQMKRGEKPTLIEYETRRDYYDWFTEEPGDG